MDNEDRTGQWIIRPHLGVVVPLVALVIAAAVLFVIDLGRLPDDPLVGRATDAALFTAALVALLGRTQYAMSVRPNLRYVSEWTAKRPGYLDEEANAARFRLVHLRNVGPGVATITRVYWVVEPASGGRARYDTITALYDALARLDLQESRDYLIVNFTVGAALAAGEEQLYFACTDSALKMFARFDAVIEFRSLSGDKFGRRLSLLPHPGAPRGAVPDSI